MSEDTRLATIMESEALASVGMIFYDSLDGILRDTDVLGYASVIERAWHEMGLDGVLCQDGRPVLYLKESAQPLSSSDRTPLQKLFWNQGVANILILADPTTVYVYSGLVKPQADMLDEEQRETALVERMARAVYVQQVQSFCLRLYTGQYYGEEGHQDYFDPDQAVDVWLLKNLRALRDALIKSDEGVDTKTAHALIGRTLFLCYLLDRGIVPIGTPKQGHTGTMLFAAKLGGLPNDMRIAELYALFGDLKDQFNGNMFDLDLDAERCFIRPSHIDRLLDFLNGRDVKTGQGTLFWPYDFKMIPVETISAIYQDFLATESKDGQQKSGAFYTPRFLAEMVVHVAMRNTPNAHDCSFLDPACGSGIFLVILFNRLASRWMRAQDKPDYVTKAEALKEILSRQICGVDKEETACRIACFSLYLAYLDFFEPRDIRSYIKKTGQPLPKLLNYGSSERPLADIPVVFMGDFLGGEALSGKQFDYVIGNPPWVDRGSKQLAQKFIEEVPRYLRKGGTGCLLLPSKILQNQTDAFQTQWLRQVTLEEVLQLADYRLLLFQGAVCPAIIARFRNETPRFSEQSIEFFAPKFSRDGLRQGIITVSPSARSWLPLADILSATESKTAPIAWKRHLWGTPRDQKLLDLLLTLPPLSNAAGRPEEGKRWVKGQGFQPYYPEKAEHDPGYPKPKPNPWHQSAPFINADRHLRMTIFQQDCITLGERLERIKASKADLRRAPRPELFKAPMVLVSQGFGKVAYSDFDVLFQDSFQSIAGPWEDADILMFLAAYLRSNLSRYFLFHTSANWGTEREKVHLSELLRVPFPLPGHESAAPEAGEIVKQVARMTGQFRDELQAAREMEKIGADSHDWFGRNHAETDKQFNKERRLRTDALQKEIEPLIYRYFGLTEQEIILVKDTIRVFEPSSTPATRRSKQTVTLDPIGKTKVEPYAHKGLRAYADTLTATLNRWAQTEKSAYRVHAEGGTDKSTGLAMVILSLSGSEEAYQNRSFSRDLMDILRAFREHASRTHGALLYERDTILFQGERIYIVRPNILFNWTCTAALNDAAKIYGDIALGWKES